MLAIVYHLVASVFAMLLPRFREKSDNGSKKRHSLAQLQQQEARWISVASLVFPLTTSSQRHHPFVVTDQGQGTLIGERCPLCTGPYTCIGPDLAQQQKVQCGRV